MALGGTARRCSIADFEGHSSTTCSSTRCSGVIRAACGAARRTVRSPNPANIGDKDDARLCKIAAYLIVSFLRKCNFLYLVRGQFHFAGDDKVIAVAVVQGDGEE